MMPRMLNVLLFFAPLIVGAFDCSKVQLDDKTIDLGSLNREFTIERNVTLQPSLNNYLYKINLCKPLAKQENIPEEDTCGVNSWGCNVVTNYKNNSARVIQVISLAEGENSGHPEFSAVKNEGKLSTVFWKMNGKTVNEVKWSSEIELVCHDSEEPKLELVSASDGKAIFKLQNKAICSFSKTPESSPPEKKPGDKAPEKKPEDKAPETNPPQEPSSGPGFFSFLFYFVLISLAVYFVVGVVYNHVVNSASGLDLIPNRDFWEELPSLIVGFVSHIFNAVRGSNRGAYTLV